MKDQEQILIFENEDKNNNITKKNPEDFVFPARIFINGAPNVGKRNAFLNYFLRLKPAINRVLLIHLDPNTTEYDIIPHEKIKLEDLSNYFSFSNDEEGKKKIDRNQRSIVIIDEVNIKGLSNKQQNELLNLFQYVSSHCNCSITLIYQDFFKVPPAFRNACNQYILFKTNDRSRIQQIAMRIDEDVSNLYELMEGICRYKNDFLFIDMESPKDTKFRYRLNLFNPIVKFL